MRTRILIAVLAVTATVAVGRLGAQRSATGSPSAGPSAGGQRGAATAPPARGGGRSGRANFEPTLWLPDDQFLRWPFTDPQYARIDGFKIKRDINDITAISRKSRDDGNQYWGRIAGTPYDKMTTDWVAAQYRRIGLEQVRVHEFTLPPQWFPNSWDVSVTGAGNTIAIKTAFPLYASVGTNGIVELEPVWAGTGLPADFLGRDVRGKAAVIYGFPDPGGRENTAMTFGAVATAERPGRRRSLSCSVFRATSPTNRPAARPRHRPACRCL